MKKWLSFLLAALLTLSLTACGGAEPTQSPESTPLAPVQSELPEVQEPALDEDGSYTSKEDVGLYLYLYGQLPQNFMTKSEARDLGWSGGGLEDYAPGMCIGGDKFGNREKLLPDAEGRKWFECDINTLGEDDRGPERIVWSSDGLIYYTPDHYASFELLYGEE